MIQIKRFRNGKPAWDVKISALAIAVFALVILALVANQHTAGSMAGWIVALFRR